MRCVILFPLIASLGCSGALPWLHGDLANHPADLVGRWVDVQKTSSRDTSVWVLEPNGYDGGLRLTRDARGEPRLERQRYGYWYVRGRSDGTQEFCVNRRPGRDAPSCTAFTTLVDSSFAPPRRAIRLAAYAGSHHTSERILVEFR